MKRVTPGLWILIALSLFVMFFQLGQLPLFDPDEPVYAETAREMLLYHDWLSPRIYGDFWYDKPPMYYWLVAASFKLLGSSEFAARLPSALMAIATVILIYVAGSRLFNRRCGFFSALVLSTSLEFFYMAKGAVTDMTLVFFLSAAYLAFLCRWYWLLYVFAALATVTKGPIGLLFPGAVIFIYLAIGRRWAYLKEMHVFRGALLYFLIAAPWYVFMAHTHGAPFIDTFFGYHNITRFTSPEHPEGVLWYYYLPVLIIGLLPWTAILVQSVRASLLTYGQTFSHLQFLNIWAVFILLFFSVSQTKLVSYILPLYPPLALVIGWYLSYLYERRYRLSFISWPLVASVLLLLLIGGLWWGVKIYPALWIGAVVCSVLFSSALIVLWLGYLRRSVATVLYSQVGMMVLFSAVLVTLLVAPISDTISTRSVAQDFKVSYDGSSPVYVTKFLHPGFTYYSEQYGKELTKPADFDQALREPKAYLLIRRQDLHFLPDAARGNLTLLAESADRMLFVKQ